MQRQDIGIHYDVLFQPHRRGCWDLAGMAFLGANGSIAACCNRWPAIGDLTVNSFEEIWNGPLQRRIFFGALNQLPVASCAGCRQLQVVEYNLEYLKRRPMGRG